MQKKLFIAVLITSFIGPFASSGLSVAIPSIGQEFIADANQLSYVVFAFLLGSAMFILPTGKLSDIFGRRKVYNIGLWLFALSFFATIFVNNIEMLVALRFVQGCVMSLIFGPGMALLVSAHPPEDRGRIIGYSAAATYSGLSMGPVLCGLLCEFLGWRSIFVATTLVVGLAIGMLSNIKEEWYGDKEAKFDITGSICFVIASPLLLYGLAEINQGMSSWLMLLAGAIGMGIFLLIEARSKSPCLDVSLLLHNPVFTLSNIAALLHYSGTFAISFLMSLYLQIICHMSASAAGCVILLQPVMMALLSPKAGVLSDHIFPGKVASVGMAVTGIGLFAFSFLTETTPLWQIGLNLLWIGVGFALFSSPNNNAIMGAIQPSYYGTASSLLATMRLFGQAISMAVVTMVLVLYQVQELNGSSNQELLLAIQHCFMIFGSLSIVGIGLSLVRNK